MEKEKTIAALNELLAINKDRMKGYEKAFENTEERDLKDVFAEFKQTSQKCIGELKDEINKFGGKVTEGTNASSKFFRAWMVFKSTLPGKEREAILKSCEYGEEQADETYQKILDDDSEELSPQQLTMIKAQQDLLRTDQNKIKSMLNSMVLVS